jgi:hypothetical protein
MDEKTIPPWERKKVVASEEAAPERSKHAPINPVPGVTNLKTSEHNLARRKTQAEALELRMTGMSFPKIAAELGITSQYAHKLVTKALQEVTQEPAEELLVLETERLDALMNAAYKRAILNGGSYDINSCLKIMERRAKLLGLDGAIKVEDVTQTESPLGRLRTMFGLSAEVQNAT